MDFVVVNDQWIYMFIKMQFLKTNGIDRIIDHKVISKAYKHPWFCLQVMHLVLKFKDKKKIQSELSTQILAAVISLANWECM